MKTNILKAMARLAEYKVNDLKDVYKKTNRINIIGEELEYYLKDLFCDCFDEEDIAKKDKRYSNYFSYIGNQNNPPDFMIKKGDAIEVKKIRGFKSGIALNSSYPKSRLMVEDAIVKEAYTSCENWTKKDYIYAIGTVINRELKLLWMVYGDCFVADRNVYERIRNKISKGVKELSDIELSKTESSIIDPLGITGFLLNSKCVIDNPIKIFDYVVPVNQNVKFSVKTIMLEKKYLSFPKEDRLRIENMGSKNFIVKNIKIKSPNNPTKLMRAKLLSLEEI